MRELGWLEREGREGVKGEDHILVQAGLKLGCRGLTAGLAHLDHSEPDRHLVTI